MSEIAKPLENLNMGRKAITLSQVSDELTGDPQTMDRLIGRAFPDYPAPCWLDPARRKVTADGRQQHLRYWLYETLTQTQVGSGFRLQARGYCVSPDCVNPAHQVRQPHQRPGRKPGQAPQQRTRSAVDVAWPEAQTILMLLVLGENAWPQECRNRCWEWTGPIQQIGLRRLPRLKGQSAHHAVWELFNRRALQGRCKRACRNELCVNPTHLIIPALTPTDPHIPAPMVTGNPVPFAQEEDTLDDLRAGLIHMLGTVHRQEDLLPSFARWLLNRRPDMHNMIRDIARHESWLRKLLVEDIRWTFQL